MYRSNVLYDILSQNSDILYTNKTDYGTCMHTHRSWIFGQVLHGCRRIEINNTVVDVTDGSYYIIPPDCPHRLLPGTCRTESLVVSIRNEDMSCFTINKNLYTGYSREHRIRKIRDIYGISPGRLEKQDKIRYAVKLLLQGYPESSAANEAGFYDQAHFCRCFKSLWGMTPGEFQQSQQTGIYQL